ncbi:sulfite exporter TauE/SafE family protein [Paenibacillus swuensis]
MGMILGFAGTGGSGFIIGLLVAVFGVPIHTALGTSIAAMIFTTLSGSVSHVREGNALWKTGCIIGGFGAFGAFAGTFVSRGIEPDILILMTSGMLLLCGLLIWVRTRMKGVNQKDTTEADFSSRKFWSLAIITGIVTGGLSGVFGIGATPFIQLALLILFGFSLRQAVGTTMVVILPIAISGSVGFLQAGFMEWGLFLEVVTGTVIGSYIGAKFTQQAPKLLLRSAMVLTPISGAIILLLRN